MSLVDEKIHTISDDPKFNAIFTERIIKERKQKRKWKIIKLAVFSVILLFYIKLYIDGWGLYFVGDPDIIYADRYVTIFPVIIILGALLMWLPKNILDGIGQMKFSVDGAGAGAQRSPPEALRLFGWVIFIAPAIFMIIYYLFI